MTTELAWAAGFYDGEGSFYCRSNRKEMVMEVSQVDLRPLERFFSVAGVGSITQNKARGRSQAIYRWRSGCRNDVLDVVNKLWPYLSEPKKEQILQGYDKFLENGGKDDR